MLFSIYHCINYTVTALTNKKDMYLKESWDFKGFKPVNPQFVILLFI